MFGKRKKEKVSFGEWLNGILSNFTLDAAAFNFNIYENKKDYSAELVATASFDEDDEDWACDEIYASRNDGNEFCFNADGWESALEFVRSSVENYLKNGTYAEKLTASQAVACGFVDGDLRLIFVK